MGQSGLNLMKIIIFFNENIDTELDPITESIYKGFYFNWKSPASSELCLTHYLPASQAKDGKIQWENKIQNSCHEFRTARKSGPSLVFHTGLCSVSGPVYLHLPLLVMHSPIARPWVSLS